MKAENMVKAIGRLKKVKTSKSGNTELILHIEEGDIMAEPTFILNGALDPEIVRGDIVEIEGRIRATRYRDGKDAQWEYEQNFIAEKVKIAKSEMEEKFGYKGTIHKPFEMRVFVSGAVSNVKDLGRKFFLVSVATKSSNELGKLNYVSTHYYNGGKLPNAAELTRGDEVNVMLKLKTTIKKKENGEERRFENLYVEDFVVLKKGDGEHLPTFE